VLSVTFRRVLAVFRLTWKEVRRRVWTPPFFFICHGWLPPPLPPTPPKWRSKAIKWSRIPGQPFLVPPRKPPSALFAKPSSYIGSSTSLAFRMASLMLAKDHRSRSHFVVSAGSFSPLRDEKYRMAGSSSPPPSSCRVCLRDQPRRPPGLCLLPFLLRLTMCCHDLT